MIKVGSIWGGSNNLKFTVRAVEERTDGTWVLYGRDSEDRTYECLVAAFLDRFKELLP